MHRNMHTQEQIDELKAFCFAAVLAIVITYGLNWGVVHFTEFIYR